MLKLLNLLGLLLAVAWLSRSPDWEPAVTSLGLLATLVAQEYSGRSVSAAAPDPDAELFQRFLQLLPSTSPAIYFLQTNNMAGFSFDYERLNDLETFVHTWDDAEHEFHNALLDEKRRELLDVSKRYLHLIAVETFPTSTGRQTVPPEWEEEQPDRFTEVVRNFHSTAQLICSLHQELIRMGRAKFRL